MPPCRRNGYITILVLRGSSGGKLDEIIHLHPLQSTFVSSTPVQKIVGSSICSLFQTPHPLAKSLSYHKQLTFSPKQHERTCTKERSHSYRPNRGTLFQYDWVFLTDLKGRNVGCLHLNEGGGARHRVHYLDSYLPKKFGLVATCKGYPLVIYEVDKNWYWELVQRFKRLRTTAITTTTTTTTEFIPVNDNTRSCYLCFGSNGWMASRTGRPLESSLQRRGSRKERKSLWT
jgi:hypothetical protein